MREEILLAALSKRAWNPTASPTSTSPHQSTLTSCRAFCHSPSLSAAPSPCLPFPSVSSYPAATVILLKWESHLVTLQLQALRCFHLTLGKSLSLCNGPRVLRGLPSHPSCPRLPLLQVCTLSLTKLWPPYSSSNASGNCLPQGLCTSGSRSLACSAPRWPRGLHHHFLCTFTQKSSSQRAPPGHRISFLGRRGGLKRQKSVVSQLWRLKS